MKIMKKIGALVCAAAISVSMVSAMPVSADYWPMGHVYLGVNQVGDEEKKKVLEIYYGKSLHCGDLYTFTTSFLWYKYVSVENQAGDLWYKGKEMKTRSVRVQANRKVKERKDKNDATLKQPCVVGPVECKGVPVEAWGYYHYA